MAVKGATDADTDLIDYDLYIFKVFIYLLQYLKDTNVMKELDASILPMLNKPKRDIFILASKTFSQRKTHILKLR